MAGNDENQAALIRMLLARSGDNSGGAGMPFAGLPFSGLPQLPKASMFGTDFSQQQQPRAMAPDAPIAPPPAIPAMDRVRTGASLGDGMLEKALADLGKKKEPQDDGMKRIRDALAASQNSLAALYNTPMANPTGGSMPKPDGSLQNYRYNLGNIRAGKDEWLGRGEPYKGFVTFSTPFYGARALYKNLYSYVGEKPDMTFAEAIAKYAPKADKNDPVGYANWVAEQSKIPVNTPLRDILNDPKKAGVVMHFMGQMEHGKDLPGEFTPEFLSSVASSVIGERE